MFLGLAAINSQANLLFAVFGLMIGVLLVSGVISRLMLAGVRVDRRLPPSAQVGRPVRLRYSVTNRKRFWPTFSLTIAELDAGGTGSLFDRQPHAYVLHAASGMAAEVAADVVPMRRGWVDLERVQIATSFPFGFIKRAVIRRKKDRLLVGPPRAALEPRALTNFLAAESTGLSQRPRQGGSDELVGIREYRSGDSPREIHWRRSARTATAGGNLVVREMRRSAPPRLLVLADTFAQGQATAEALGAVEKNLAVAASLIAGASDRGLSVGLVVWTGNSFLEAKPDRGKRHREELLQALAESPRNGLGTLDELTTIGQRMAKGDTTGVFITAVETVSLPIGRASANLQRIETKSPMLEQIVQFPDTLDWQAMATSA